MIVVFIMGKYSSLHTCTNSVTQLLLHTHTNTCILLMYVATIAHLIRISYTRAVITRISNTIAIRVCLEGVVDKGAVVATVDDTISVYVRVTHITNPISIHISLHMNTASRKSTHIHTYWVT
jgi:hypothetical protein